MRMLVRMRNRVAHSIEEFTLLDEEQRVSEIGELLLGKKSFANQVDILIKNMGLGPELDAHSITSDDSLDKRLATHQQKLVDEARRRCKIGLIALQLAYGLTLTRESLVANDFSSSSYSLDRVREMNQLLAHLQQSNTAAPGE